MAGSFRIRETLLFIALSPLLFVIFLLLLVLWLPVFVAYRSLLRLAFEALVIAKGRRRILLVYSRSPVWQEYIERNWLPLLADHAMVLNWSDRATWKGRRSFAVWVFHHWAPSYNFNPMAIVLPGFRPAKCIGFYYAFRDWKHGKEETLRDAEKQLFVYLGEVQKPSA
jgi:hypothetical protein